MKEKARLPVNTSSASLQTGGQQSESVAEFIRMRKQIDNPDGISALMAFHGGKTGLVDQAMLELLARDNLKRITLLSMLGTHGDLEPAAPRSG